ncbi:hypothetical protein SODALDRAFT_356472 [Sodiomyces alkalinus F11]|uniref:Uncharacterized protein n=1 Tax=Sodiomyces alkalinus (strain CBS 110278 / VKM F-3762 / F11) TaxID=1314773 RepID=A0A3N2Q142_SODAK|nr:hypothetical protein SODALDRAFT_356472 [Sodiomyces alkalinus F11]ROT40483.1 hypothetical protein SODALDRAFT_356472 [Sodiomyces alkalinus F11]
MKLAIATTIATLSAVVVCQPVGPEPINPRQVLPPAPPPFPVRYTRCRPPPTGSATRGCPEGEQCVPDPRQQGSIGSELMGICLPKYPPRCNAREYPCADWWLTCYETDYLPTLQCTRTGPWLCNGVCLWPLPY